MKLATRKLLDRSFSGLGVMSIAVLASALVVLLAPIIWRGSQAFIFKATVEHRKLYLERFGRGNSQKISAEIEKAGEARKPIYDAISQFEEELKAGGILKRRKYEPLLDELKEPLRKLLGPLPGDSRPALIRSQYGQTRWDRTEEALHNVLFRTEWQADTDNPSGLLKKVYVPREPDFEGTPIASIFPYVENNIDTIMAPRVTFYWRFLFDESRDAYFAGGIWPAMLGTLCLTIGAMIFAVPMGVIAAIYLVEYASDNWLVRVIRTCISTLAGVPSIVFGLFGLAFFINGIGISQSKSLLAGSMTLSLLVLPIIIRASEEAIKSVPHTYKEAALSLGASKWWAVATVILPAALPGILTGIVISMGRAAGETAPIIFTAAVSVGRPIFNAETLQSAKSFLGTLFQPTPALPWNIYNLATEHEAVDELRHVQFGMVLTLVALVLLLNGAALILRARISRKLKG